MKNSFSSLFICLLTTVFSLNLYASNVKGELLSFEKACTTGKEVKIGAAGDILMHLVLQVQALRFGGYSHLWEELEPVMEKMDVMYGNLESPIAPGLFLSTGIPNDRDFYRDSSYQHLLKQGYSNFPRFNVGPELLQNLRKHFDILSTANNHAFDRGEEGVDATIENLNRYGYNFKETQDPSDGDYSGTLTRDPEHQIWHAEAEFDGVKIAFLACTEHTNGLNSKNNFQILRCYNSENNSKVSEKVLQLVRQLSEQFDAVIVTPHWGDEYKKNVDRVRENFSQIVFENGALAVLGSHPHVVQKWQKFTNVTDIFGLRKDRFVIYSLGNFFANQGKGRPVEEDVKQRTGIVLTLGLVKDDENQTYIQGVKYLPYYMTTSTTAVLSKGRRSAVLFNDHRVQTNKKLAEQVRIANQYIDDVLPYEQRIKEIDDQDEFNWCP